MIGPSGAHLPASDRRRHGLGAIQVSKQAAKHKSLLDYGDLGQAFRSLAATAGPGWRDFWRTDGHSLYAWECRPQFPWKAIAPCLPRVENLSQRREAGRRGGSLKTQPTSPETSRYCSAYFGLRIKGIQECT